MVKILMMSTKVATPGFLKIKVFWNKGYYVIYYVYDVNNKILSHDSNYIMDVVMWSRFGNSGICIREVIITSVLQGFDQKNRFFERWSSFKFNNLGLALGTNLKFYTSLSKGLKLKVRKFWGLIPTFVEVTGEKLVGGSFCPSPPFPSWIGLKYFYSLSLCLPLSLSVSLLNLGDWILEPNWISKSF